MNKFLMWLKNLFIEEVHIDNDELIMPTTTDKFSRSNKNNSFNQFQAENILSTKRVTSGSEYQKIIKHVEKHQKKLNLEEVKNLINLNVFYLEKLCIAMENSIYVMEFEKVKELLEQSKNCMKLLNYINASKIFYQNTTSFVVAHAIQVAQLTEHLKNVDINELKEQIQQNDE